MKAAGSPDPALPSKSSSVSLSGNRHSILQESLPTSITDKRLKDTLFPQTPAFKPVQFQALISQKAVAANGGLLRAGTQNVVITAQTKALDAFRGQTVDD